jgi:hypothetical protein
MRRVAKVAILACATAASLFVAFVPVVPYAPVSTGPSGFDHSSISFDVLGRGMLTGVVYSDGRRFYEWCAKFDEGGVACDYDVWPNSGFLPP